MRFIFFILLSVFAFHDSTKMNLLGDIALPVFRNVRFSLNTRGRIVFQNCSMKSPIIQNVSFSLNPNPPKVNKILTSEVTGTITRVIDYPTKVQVTHRLNGFEEKENFELCDFLKGINGGVDVCPIQPNDFEIVSEQIWQSHWPPRYSVRVNGEFNGQELFCFDIYQRTF